LQPAEQHFRDMLFQKQKLIAVALAHSPADVKADKTSKPHAYFIKSLLAFRNWLKISHAVF